MTKSAAHHLTAAHVRALARLARLRELPLLHHVLHPGAPLDDDEAVGLLNHQADEADGRLEVVAQQRRQDLALRLDDSHRAHRFVAVLEAAVAGAAVGAGRTLDDAPALTLFRLRDTALGEHVIGDEDGHRDQKQGGTRFSTKHKDLQT